MSGQKDQRPSLAPILDVKRLPKPAAPNIYDLRQEFVSPKPYAFISGMAFA